MNYMYSPMVADCIRDKIHFIFTKITLYQASFLLPLCSASRIEVCNSHMSGVYDRSLGPRSDLSSNFSKKI